MHVLAILAATTSLAAPADLVIENARLWSPGADGFAPFAAASGGRWSVESWADKTPTRRTYVEGKAVFQA